MNREQIKAGIIGSGFAASFHFEAIKKVYSVDVKVAGVYSRNQQNREKFAEKRGIQAFSSLEELCDRCDVIHVCAPVSVHEPIAVMALERDKYPIVEKPLTGFCGDGSEDFRGDRYPKEKALQSVSDSIERILAAEQKSKAKLLYAENWVYAPAIQKEREIIEKTGAQILWIHGEESHSGSHASTYAYWKFSGGGVMLGKVKRFSFTCGTHNGIGSCDGNLGAYPHPDYHGQRHRSHSFRNSAGNEPGAGGIDPTHGHVGLYHSTHRPCERYRSVLCRPAFSAEHSLGLVRGYLFSGIEPHFDELDRALNRTNLGW